MRIQSLQNNGNDSAVRRKIMTQTTIIIKVKIYETDMTVTKVNHVQKDL